MDIKSEVILEKDKRWNEQIDEAYIDVQKWMEQARELLEDENPTLGQVIAVAALIQKQFFDVLNYLEKP